jgi:hypothetical protein
MSYLFTVPCGCVVHVVREPNPTRVIVLRGADCFKPGHDVGRRLFLWEMLPDPVRGQAAERVERGIEWP